MELEHLPDQLKGRKFYDPAVHCYEETIKERMDRLRGYKEDE